MQIKIDYIKYLLWLLVFIPMFLLRDYTPDNELRYLNIADDAIQNGNIFTFYNDGAIYADKPPLYLWIVMLSKIIWGKHSMVWLGLFSVLPAFVIIEVMDNWVKKVLEPTNRLTVQLMLLTTVFFIGSMAVLRMDMLMSMFIVLALYTFYQFYSYRLSKYLWLFPIYIFLALFTKGPYGIMIPIFSILVFLILKKQYKLIGIVLGWHIWGVLIGLSLLWFLGVYFEGGKPYLDDLLFNQTVNRAVDSFSHKKGFLFYFETIWYAAAPWSLLYGMILFLCLRNKIYTTDLEHFFLTVFSVTFITLSFISSKLEIYLLPVYPFIAYLTIIGIQKLYRGQKWILICVTIPAIVITLAFPAIFVVKSYVPSLEQANIFVYGLALILSLGGLFSIYMLFLKNNLNYGINSIAISLLCGIFIGSFSIPDFNGEIGYGKLAEKGKEIAVQNGIDKFYSYRVPRAGGMKVYLNKNVKELPRDTYKDELSELKNILLFLRNRDIERNDSLKKLIEEKPQYIQGPYRIVIW